MGKRERRKKKKEFLVKRARGILGPAEHARDRPSLACQRGTVWGRRRGRGPTCQRGEGGWCQGEMAVRPRGRRNRPTAARRRFLIGDSVLGGRGGGIARAGVGGHGGGVNLACGGSGQPVHGEVAGSRGNEVAGDATGRDRGRRMVHRVRAEVVKLVNYVNWTLGHRRRKGELTGAKGEGGGAGLIELG
jgi:hypothetical protein